MKDTAGHADTEDGEQDGFSRLFSFSIDLQKKRHGGQTCCSTGCGVEQTKKAGEKQAGKENPDGVDEKSGMHIHSVEREYDDQIGKSKLDPGKAWLEWNERLEEGEHKRQSGQHTYGCQLLR